MLLEVHELPKTLPYLIDPEIWSFGKRYDSTRSELNKKLIKTICRVSHLNYLIVVLNR